MRISVDMGGRSGNDRLPILPSDQPRPDPPLYFRENAWRWALSEDRRLNSRTVKIRPPKSSRPQNATTAQGRAFIRDAEGSATFLFPEALSFGIREERPDEPVPSPDGGGTECIDAMIGATFDCSIGG